MKNLIRDQIKLLKIIGQHKLPSIFYPSYSFGEKHNLTCKSELPLDLDKSPISELNNSEIVKKLVNNLNVENNICFYRVVMKGGEISTQKFLPQVSLNGIDIIEVSGPEHILRNNSAFTPKEGERFIGFYSAIEIQIDAIILEDLQDMFTCTSPDFFAKSPTDLLDNTFTTDIARQSLFLQNTMSLLALFKKEDRQLVLDIMDSIIYNNKPLSDIMEFKMKTYGNKLSVFKSLNLDGIKRNKVNIYDTSLHGLYMFEKNGESIVVDYFDLFSPKDYHKDHLQRIHDTGLIGGSYSKRLFAYKTDILIGSEEEAISKVMSIIDIDKKAVLVNLKRHWDKLVRRTKNNPNITRLVYFKLLDSFISVNINKFLLTSDGRQTENEPFSFYLFREVFNIEPTQFFDTEIPRSYIDAFFKINFDSYECMVYDKTTKFTIGSSHRGYLLNSSGKYTTSSSDFQQLIFPFDVNIKFKKKSSFNRRAPSVVIINDTEGTGNGWRVKVRKIIKEKVATGEWLPERNKYLKIFILEPDSKFELLKLKHILQLRPCSFSLKKLINETKLNTVKKGSVTRIKTVDSIITARYFSKEIDKLQSLKLDLNNIDIEKYLFIPYLHTRSLVDVFDKKGIDLPGSTQTRINVWEKLLQNLEKPKIIIYISEANYKKIKKIFPDAKKLDEFLTNPINKPALVKPLYKFIWVQSGPNYNQAIHGVESLIERLWGSYSKQTLNPFDSLGKTAMISLYQAGLQDLMDNLDPELSEIFCSYLINLPPMTNSNAFRYGTPNIYNTTLSYPSSMDIDYKIMSQIVPKDIKIFDASSISKKVSLVSHTELLNRFVNLSHRFNDTERSINRAIGSPSQHDAKDISKYLNASLRQELALLLSKIEKE